MGQSPSISLPSSLPSLALHVLRTAENSPSYDALEPFFDYLVGLDSSSVESQQSLDTEALSKILADNEGGKVVLKVYNAKSQRIRDVALSPSRDWAEGLKAPSLGLSLRVCNPAHALESVYHVLDVLEGSPAEMAGLVPWGDFVLAWSGGPLHSENDFYQLVEAHVDKPLRLFVYNSDLDNLREVILYPTRQWGGEGLIGCGIGYGLLHRIPRPSTPPQTIFAEEDYFNVTTPKTTT
ncbi:GRASP55/65 PDZ-like domain-containing protein [Papiliotrema laurentii]|uniref:GRASP55/65 PDZ-like domain-containing protein n=1 Tax=Papiliotrema laurentii TaxID=5418 RepID=A0AAD9D260_PAPLA|nr:GRASP55/65 PDZ-like domain-containing protein [Papiliotrema laurentii]